MSDGDKPNEHPVSGTLTTCLMVELGLVEVPPGIQGEIDLCRFFEEEA